MIKNILQKKWVKGFLIILGLCFLLFIGLYSSIYFGFWGALPTKEELGSLKQAEATQVLDKNGHLIGKYYIYDRQPIVYRDLPQHLIDALIATEDMRFYEHNGVDNKSLLRVFFKTILLGDRSSGGGSTITLQLAKNLYGRKDYGAFSIPVNKLKESFVAKRIEEIYSKQEILTLYFNTVPFPDNTYGIESAAQKFFSKPTNQLNLSEAATLIGSLKANHSYNPRLFPERSQLRRDVVLQQMVKSKYISSNLADKTMGEPIQLKYQYFNHDLGLAPYFREMVKKELFKILKKHKKSDKSDYDLYNDGLIVYTTLDSKMQLLAEEAMKEHMQILQNVYEKSYGNNPPWKNKAFLANTIKKLEIYNSYKKQGLTESQIIDSLSKKKEIELFEWKKNITKKISSLDSLQHYMKFLNAGMIAIEPSTGAVQTYLGGIDYRYFKYDHVSQSERQVGSTFKPFVYTAAVENGLKPCTYFSTKEVTYTNLDNWTPKNASEKEDPYLNYTLEKALSTSVNTIAVKVLNEVGIPNVIQQVRKLGITAPLSEKPAMALGTDAIKLKELAGAYASYINNGRSVKPYFITKIEDQKGNLIASFEPRISDSTAYSEYTRQVLLEMMKSTVNQGTAARLRTTYKLQNDIAGKTGTTQDNKDGWFVGITPELITVTWVGNDNYNMGFKTTALGQGANTALPIFAKWYQKMNQNSDFDTITKSKFASPSTEVLQDLNCKPQKRDNFLKRLFGKKKKKRKFSDNT
ncbi:transglycosylase domain-containing protein [Aquimarina sp. 2201CG5-10]|uniref:transglycosylase domain-containing protein n=1 Tax=Aquimarina callyspongiae TaxID=3098150 RepID=UPI002AB423F9|nr:transglycosylase domain-containing protein [Aquimarina sp. 2201CG5-10]MDY8134111.1 transglycosylase domain-containing protein [Aquimarina sp. 2201CG5-10]